MMKELINQIQLAKSKLPNRFEKDLSNWVFDEGLTYYQGRLYVPNDDNIKFEILKRYHDSPGAGHPGREKTLDLISRNYWWPSVTTYVHTYVDGCLDCQANKILPRKPQNLMGRHDIPEKPWEVISVDFITDLPTDQHKDAIFVVIDYLTKQAHFLPCTKETTSENLFLLYLHNVWKLHGTPRKIVSDRGPQLSSEFTKAIQEGLGIETALSTAHHPQTDGQTERVNQTLETYLRIYTNHQQEDWVNKLPLAEFAYNNNKHTATGESPFFLNYGYDLTFEPQLLTLNKVPAVNERLEMLKESREEAKILLQRTQDKMSKEQNLKDSYEPYNEGDKVWLEATNLKTYAPTKKLDAKRLGPFTISKRIGYHAYKLKLPPHMKGIHPVFHKNLLRPFKENQIPQRKITHPEPIEILPDSERYEVESILNSRKRGRGIQYLVKWKNFEPIYNTWEPSRNIDQATELINQFHKKNPRKPKILLRSTEPKKGVMS